ncbi:carbohydrate kinase [Maritalea myrionectae]|uniref:carbohydrate kinase n=1 Tax=Maritalea myrionectae TaxID=454601 RepID=UPI0003FA180E|nr:carbohydrate kinase [Maritalea myrionectae]
MSLTDLEQRLLAEITAHPYASQKELGERLGVARATVANYIERLQAKGYILGRAYIVAQQQSILCIGGAVMDRVLKLKEPGILETSNPASAEETRGGVARNVAENLARLGEPTKLLSIVGDDGAADALSAATTQSGVDLSHMVRNRNLATGTYTAIMQPDGSLYLGVADMDIFNQMDAAFVQTHLGLISGSALIFADTNLSTDGLAKLVTHCRDQNIPLAVDTVSIPKFKRLPDDLSGISYLFCNKDEALAATEQATPDAMITALISRGAEHVIITDGANGVYLSYQNTMQHLAVPAAEIVDVSGAGDAFVAGTLHGLNQKLPLAQAAQFGIAAAQHTLKSTLRNSPDLSHTAVETFAHQHFASN